MKNNGYIKWLRYKTRNMYIAWCEDYPDVMSYNTIIGFIDLKRDIFYTFGYGRYSSTTSKQITMLCHELGLKCVDIEYLEPYYIGKEKLIDKIRRQK